MKVGNYIRTDKGFIDKIIDFKENYTKGRRLNRAGEVEEVIENYLLLDNKQVEMIESIDYTISPCYPTDEELEKIKAHIVKSSPNIIDLIEVGDYVNGCMIVNKKDDTIQIIQLILPFDLKEKDIKSVVTKEQFENMEYKIGE